MTEMIFLNRVFLTGKEETYFSEALRSSQDRGMLSGDGAFTKKASSYLEDKFNSHKVLLTHSCTAALEMAAILADIRPGDEVIMPSYTFVSTANAFVLRGGVPVFVDIRPDTMNIDETLIEAAITKKTKAIVPVHYAGAACEMDTIMQIAETHDLLVIEDAAQAIYSTYKGHPLGGIGHLGCYSFHETKNIVCGEGGALLINDARFADRAEIVREKGTDRSAFMDGRVDKYTWRDIGSSYLPPDTSAAFLLAQLEAGEETTRVRREAWNEYDTSLRTLEGFQNAGVFERHSS
jgi:dTDP-4-amino-4,6-dideoxygalactose transaminase